MADWESFLQESKKFQVIRFLNIIYEDMFHIRDTTNSTKLSDKLKNKINDHLEFYHNIDLTIKISSWFQLYSPMQNRIFAPTDDWIPFNPDIKYPIHPLYIFFCSSINEMSDLKLREALTINIDSIPAHIEPISYYVYNNILINEFFSIKDLAEIIKKGDLFLLFFQAKTRDLMKSIAKPKQFFDEVFTWEKVEEDKSKYEWIPVMGGLLRGDYDGFILFSCQKENSIEELKTYLNTQSTGSDGFFNKIAPISLYFGKRDNRFNYREENIEILHEICKIVYR